MMIGLGKTLVWLDEHKRLRRILRTLRSPVFHPLGQYRHDVGVRVQQGEESQFAVIGLPKSGNNWLAFLLQDALSLAYKSPREAKSFRNRALFKTHEKLGPDLLFRPRLHFGVYLMRDLRDIVCSFYHHTKTERYVLVNPVSRFESLEDFYFEHFLTRLVPTFGWIEHAQSYIARGVPLIKYERLFDAPEQELQRLFHRWGVEVAQERLTQAISNNEIGSLRKGGKTVASGDESFRVQSDHFRRGGYGHYAQELPPVVLRDIESRFANYLSRWGYEIKS